MPERFEIKIPIVEELPLDINKVVVELAHLLEVSISKKALLKYRLADQLPLITWTFTNLSGPVSAQY